MLKDLGIGFKILAPNIDEKRLRGEPVLNFVQRLAREKAEAVADQIEFHAQGPAKGDWAVLAADTIVVHGNQVFGKPVSKDDAVKMLKRLSGRTHEVITAFCWIGTKAAKESSHVGVVRTKVTFAEMDSSFWTWYAATGEPMDKAGAYAAQGIGMSFIQKVSGSYSNVIGLPLPQVLQAFEKIFGEDLREACSKSK